MEVTQVTKKHVDIIYCPDNNLVLSFSTGQSRPPLFLSLQLFVSLLRWLLRGKF